MGSSKSEVSLALRTGPAVIQLGSPTHRAWRDPDLNRGPPDYEPGELPSCSIALRWRPGPTGEQFPGHHLRYLTRAPLPTFS